MSVTTAYLIDCPPVGKQRIQRCDEKRAIIVDNVLLTFTQIEYRLLLLLLNNMPIASDHDLLRVVFECDVCPSAQKCLKQHIYKMQTKIQVVGLNIYRITQLGYALQDTAQANKCYTNKLSRENQALHLQY